MLGRRTMFKKFRVWFEPCNHDPIRLDEHQFKELLCRMFHADTRYFDYETAVYVLKKLGFKERRNIKRTFYLRPTTEFYLEAIKKGVNINSILLSDWKNF